MNEKNELLFVYGTLMRGECAHAMLEGARWLQPDLTEPCFKLVQIEWYPALVRGGSVSVHGELYRVSSSLLWAKLDAYENCPEMYERVCVKLASGAAAYCYVLRVNHGYPEIRSGDWRSR